MTWSEARRYNRALRQAEADLDRSGDGVIVWRPEYVETFATPQQLWLALRSRWTTTVHAQVDRPLDADGTASWPLRELAARHRGVLAALGRGPEFRGLSALGRADADELVEAVA
jgi:hypothetical protein